MSLSRTDMKCISDLFALATKPPALFDKASLRKGNKSSLCTAFKYEDTPKIPEDCIYVIDGGHLLHSVVWPRPATHGDVLACYINCIIFHYGNNCAVVFDGYSEEPIINCCEII
ncbi:hypothetical protein PR048_026859 [Dryococelus australis]|uniref:Uncharacterized protein n=1 Tax=Dryococelus australis TaxID=614101 RepID=A0ABQ9GMG3_9NEOP|nr:hypothetical protein PR048_026859 [Dryococelus australis]